MSRARRASGSIEVVVLDVGGVLYGDATYRASLLLALRELGADVSDRSFDLEYGRCRDAQDGSFRRHIAAAFLGGGEEAADRLQAAASRHWRYPPEALEPDALLCLEALHRRYRLSIAANQPSHVREAMTRDGLDRYIEVWGVSEELGIEKPDPRLFTSVVSRTGVPVERAVMVGDRLDYDVLPAQRAGMRAVWLLRGEAPLHPTPQQIGRADATIHSLEQLPGTLERLAAEPASG